MLMKMNSMMRRKDDQKGFTLVELIVVMAILAVLAALAVPRFAGVLDKSEKKAHNANVDMIENAGELWYIQTDQTGAKDAALLTTFTDADDGDLVGDFLDEDPVNPMTDATGYTIGFDSDGNATVTPLKETL